MYGSGFNCQFNNRVFFITTESQRSTKSCDVIFLSMIGYHPQCSKAQKSLPHLFITCYGYNLYRVPTEFQSQNFRIIGRFCKKLYDILHQLQDIILCVFVIFLTVVTIKASTVNSLIKAQGA